MKLERSQALQVRLDRNNAIFDHWLAGKTTTELAEKTQLGQQYISDVIQSAYTGRLANNTHN